MGFDLTNKKGNSIRVSGGHWAVFLLLAETFGWKPEGTKKPANLDESQQWNGRYDSNDGQIVCQNDAIALAKYLHGAAINEKLPIALSDVIKFIENQVASTGIAIPEQMRMKVSDFNEEFSPLLMFLYEGEFEIY